MPEIAEIARIVNFLRTHLKNRRIASIIVEDDANVYGKVGTTAEEFKKALTGRTVLDAKQQGKYFWLEMDKPPHPLMHFGMTGWIKFNNIETGYYKKEEGGSKGNKGIAKGNADNVPEAAYNNAGSTATDEWPPKYSKFVLQMEGDPKVEAAFVDSRRFARIRLINVPADQMRTTTPLKENGPDPVIDKEILTEKWLTEKLKSKHVPVKALLLDQANISGIGNWVGDEILYNARIHPEQYSDTLTEAQCKQLHKSLMYVCSTACGLLADSDQFPSDWLFKHRWSKGKNNSPTLPNGDKIVFVTVGGRTSATVPSKQKKTGPVAGDVKDEDVEADEADDKVNSKANGKAKKGKAEKAAVEPSKPATKPKAKKEAKKEEVKSEDVSAPASSRKRKANTSGAAEEAVASKKKAKAEDPVPEDGRRRSTRTRM